MKKLKHLDTEKINELIETSNNHTDAINKIIDWINDHDKVNKKIIKQMDDIYKMRKKEHELTMNLGKASQSMMNIVKKIEEE